MKLTIKIDGNDIKKIRKTKSGKVSDKLIDEIKDKVAEEYFPGLSLKIDSSETGLNAGYKWAIEELFYQKVTEHINNKTGILWGATKIDGVKHWIGYAKNGIRYSAAKFLNHSDQHDKYIVVRMEPIPANEKTYEHERMATFLSDDVKKYINSNSLNANFKDKQIDYKVPSYSHWARETVHTDIVNSDAMHSHMHNHRFNIFSMCAYANMDEVKRACAKDIKNIFDKNQITWREFIKGPTGSFITGEIEFLSDGSPMYMIDIEDDNSFKVALVKSDYETIIKRLNNSVKDGREAIKLCEGDLQNSNNKNNESRI